MKFYSSNDKHNIVSAKEAVMQGIAKDGGLFMPIEIPRLPQEFFIDIENLSFTQIAYKIAKLFFQDEIPSKDLLAIVTDAINFEAPLIRLDEKLNVLELFHGPTLAFKDFGARFMARAISYFNKNNDRNVTILVATSGDTGSAVANGFLNQPGINVILLYPSGMVSKIQEKQLTTLTGNITALEVVGTFDDCQRLVKSAFLDKEITKRHTLSSANSINIARLIPQTFYYFSAYSQLDNKEYPIIISVPSGNLGNLTAGLIAREMGLPVSKFVSALNANDVFLDYLNSGNFEPKTAVATISNAMDVGNPSNFARILALYNKNLRKIKDIIYGASFSDKSTRSAIQEIYSEYGYIMDPHGSIGYLAIKKYLNENRYSNFQGIIFETAHPGKFSAVVNEELKINIEMPAVLKECLEKEKKAIKISNKFEDFKAFILKN